jgi:hypothetical protein
MSRIVALSLLGLAALASTAVPAGPAAATSPSLTCEILRSSSPARPITCGTFRAASTYAVHNAVANGPSSGYDWTVPAGITSPTGCSFTAAFCDFTFRSDNSDHDLTTSVRINGSAPLTVTAVIPAVCGNVLC